MAVRRWAALIVLSLISVPVCAQQAQQQSQQPSQSTQQTKSSTQDLPATPQPQPTAGQKKPEPQKATTPPLPPPQEPPEPGPYGPNGPSAATQPPRSAPPSDVPGASSSTEDKVDITPPANDAKAHPNADEDLNDTGEFHPFDPHRAGKDIEVGDFYFKRRNYEAAASRYREALLYKPNDAIATYSLAESLEKSGKMKEAVKNYQSYLKILPYGPKAKDAQKALERLKSKVSAGTKPIAAKVN